MIRSALVPLAALVILSCGGGKQFCSITTCSGCCSADGICRMGVDDDACGSKGISCSSCSSGLQCRLGTCVPGTGTGGGIATGGGQGGAGGMSGGGEGGGVSGTGGGVSGTGGGVSGTGGGVSGTGGGVSGTGGGVSGTGGGVSGTGGGVSGTGGGVSGTGGGVSGTGGGTSGTGGGGVTVRPDGGTGSPCTASSQCKADIFDQPTCVPERLSDGGITGWPMGYCSSSCSLNLCPGNGICVGNGYCLSACSPPEVGQASCRPGYICDQLYRSDGGLWVNQGVCLPNCHNVGAGCTNGATCNALGHCQ